MLKRKGHSEDSECTLGPDDSCVECQVHHGAPCECCGGRGFHWNDCAELDYELAVDAADRERD